MDAVGIDPPWGIGEYPGDMAAGVAGKQGPLRAVLVPA